MWLNWNQFILLTNSMFDVSSISYVKDNEKGSMSLEVIEGLSLFLFCCLYLCTNILLEEENNINRPRDCILFMSTAFYDDTAFILETDVFFCFFLVSLDKNILMRKKSINHKQRSFLLLNYFQGNNILTLKYGLYKIKNWNSNSTDYCSKQKCNKSRSNHYSNNPECTTDLVRCQHRWQQQCLPKHYYSFS